MGETIVKIENVNKTVPISNWIIKPPAYLRHFFYNNKKIHRYFN